MIHIYALIFYISILVFPFVGIIVWFWVQKKWRIIPIIGTLLSILFIYSRFIEPYWLMTYYEKANFQEPALDIRVAIVSDIHLSLHKREDFLAKIVSTINTEKPDFVLIPGDFTYYLSHEELFFIFKGLRDIEAPVYVVTGNHDGRSPGEFTSAEVRAALEPHDVVTIDNKIERLTLYDKEITLIGLSDLWEGKTDYRLLEQVNEEEFTIILTHNPDTAYELPNHKADLLVAGHTHGGQIRIPFLYQRMIPTEHPFDRGWYEVGGMPVFVTSGAGEVGLPMRFGVPPEVVILEL